LKRRDALRRHRLQVTLIAALLGVLLVLLAMVVPRLRSIVGDFGMKVSPWAMWIFDLSDFVAPRVWLFFPLYLAVVGVLWTSVGLLDRQGPPNQKLPDVEI
jgi:type II secretory pathway component PulF